MAVRNFVQKHTELLSLEREAEIAETSALIENTPLKELQRRGVCLLKLHLVNQSTGLYGRTLVKFAPNKGHGDGNLPAHNLNPGDIVGVGQSHGGGASSTDDPSGIVSKVTQVAITVAFDHKDTEGGSVTFDHEGLYRLTKLANDVTYRRLKKALQSLDSYTTGPASHVIDVLFGEADVRPQTRPDQPTSDQTGSSDFQLFNENLDQSQQDAMTFALSQRDVAVIHGPPGTGKTTTVVEIIRQAVKQKLKVLACAPSNIAVDNLVERLAASKVRIVRIGHPARLLPSIQKHALDAIVASSDEAKIVQDVRKEIDQTRIQLSKSKQGKEKRHLRDEAKILRKELRERERHAIREILQRADVVLATNTSASLSGPLSYLPKDHFDVVVIDECAQAVEASCWIPLMYAPRCILAGDHQQLPPTILSDKAASDGLAVSLMERAVNLHSDQITKMLTTQYRMNAAIMQWSSNELYESKLTAADSVSSHLLSDLPGVEETEDTSVPLVLIDTTGCDLYELEVESEVSKGNEGEADLVVVHVERLLASGLAASEIAVIAPYNLQVELLRLRLSGRHPRLEIKSVDGFQGREKEAVVISLVRSNSRGEVGFLAEDRRINVAVTRARRHVAVICDSETVSHHGFLKNLVEYMSTNGEVRSAFQYQEEIDISEYTRPDHLLLRQSKQSSGTEKGTRPKQPRPQAKHYNIPGNKERTFDAEASAKKEIELTEQVQRFSRDQTRDEIQFPSNLNSHDRLVVHQVSEKLGLNHFSVGEGKDRHITISKKPIAAEESKVDPSQGALGEKSLDDANVGLKGTDSNVDVIIEELGTKNPMEAISDLALDAQEVLTHNAEGSFVECDHETHWNHAADFSNVECKNNTKVSTEATEHSSKTKKLSTEAQEQSTKTTNVSPEAQEQSSQTTKVQTPEVKEPVEKIDLYKCKFCKKKLPAGNVFLHEIHCEKVTEDKQRLKDASAGAKKKMDKSKQRNLLEKTTEEDFDALIAIAIKSDTRCNYVKCKEKISLTGILCQFCNRRYCFGHNMPEVHGCTEMARAHARKVVHREKVVRAGSGVKERKVDPNVRAHLERQLDKKRNEMAEKRTRKSSKKK
ncbi:DNA-binding protein SMUBP-2-like [Asterias amurensis]|uniref:DNA-binding protein SMUBP-2-like n=1 Tax=Asterias amurensis TaxID=7602 RepID=UPI003AB85723